MNIRKRCINLEAVALLPLLFSALESFTPSTFVSRPHASLHRTDRGKTLIGPKEITQLYSTITPSDDKTAGSTSDDSDSAPDNKSSTSSDDDFIAAAFEKANLKNWEEAIPYEDLTVGVVKETFGGENRVSLSPESAATLIKAGLHVVVQSGGKGSLFLTIVCF